MIQWTPEALNELPQDGVYRLRGYEATRLETFVDAAYAFAVTLLVISIDNIPDSYDAFVNALLQTPAFIVSFFQLMMFWLGHRASSRRYGLESPAVLWISLCLVAGVLIIVYPLRLMYGAGLSYITDGLLPTTINFSFEQMKTIFVLYGSAFGAMSFLIALLFFIALKASDQLSLSEQEKLDTWYEVQAWAILTSTGFISVVIALYAEGLWIIAAGWLYMALVFIMPLQSWNAQRAVNRLAT